MEPIIGQPEPAASGLIKDSDTEHFGDDVILASKEAPVVVDFWAPWCGPCKQLTPVLEKAVAAANGKVKLVKINVDENQALAQQLRIQSIPTVYAFDQGQPVDGFVGAQPESRVRALVERLAGGGLGPSPVDEALERAKEMLDAGDHGQAAQLYAQVLKHEAGNGVALAGLARCYLATGDFERAEQTLALVPDEHANNPEVAAARAALELARASSEAGDIEPLRQTVAQNPDDHQARHDFALALFAAGQREAAVDELLESISRDRAWNDEAARKELLRFFDAMGPADPVTVAARRRLSSILFS